MGLERGSVPETARVRLAIDPKSHIDRARRGMTCAIVPFMASVLIVVQDASHGENGSCPGKDIPGASHVSTFPSAEPAALRAM